MGNETIQTNTTSDVDPTAQPQGGAAYVEQIAEDREERGDRSQYIRGPGAKVVAASGVLPPRASIPFNNVRGYHDGVAKPEERGEGRLSEEADPEVNATGMAAARRALRGE